MAIWQGQGSSILRLRDRVAAMLAAHRGSILHAIGDTPLVRLERLNPQGNAEICAKLESHNPSGSLKDRIVLYLIADLEQRGELTEGKTIVEASSGNTGISLAMVGAVLDYDVLITMPDDVSVERRKLIEAYGAKLRLTPGSLGTDGAIEEARRLGREEGCAWLAQHYNEANALAHYETTGSEILQQVGARKIAAFVATSGTTGTLMGVSKRLKEADPRTKTVAVWPEEEIMGLRRPVGESRPGIYHERWVDEIVEVRDGEAKAAAGELARSEGLLVGPSSGAAFLGALRTAERIKDAGEDTTVVVLFPDGGERYFSTDAFRRPKERSD